WRDTFGNDLLNRAEWATISRFYEWLNPPSEPVLSTADLPAGITSTDLIPAQGTNPGTPTQPVDLLYVDGETASSLARAFLFREDRIIDQGAPVAGTTVMNLIGSQVGDRLCLIDIDVAPTSTGTPRHQFGCDSLVAGDNELPLRKDKNWAPVILLTPVTTLTMEIEIAQPVNVPLVARLYPEDGNGYIEAQLSAQNGPASGVRGTFVYTAPIMSGFVQVYAAEVPGPSFPRREAIIDYGANGGGLPGPTSSFGHAPVIASADGRAVFLLTEGVTLQEGEFIAWQSMIGRPPLPPTLEMISAPYRLIALPPELVDAGVISIRYPALETLANQSAALASSSATPAGVDQPQGELALHYWTGSIWQELPTDFVEDPNGDMIASAPSQGIGIYALLASGGFNPPALYVPTSLRE
ncbi:MAG: hypothetical protein WDZ49_00745, partial [Litorilinea sp.]